MWCRTADIFFFSGKFYKWDIPIEIYFAIHFRKQMQKRLHRFILPQETLHFFSNALSYREIIHHAIFFSINDDILLFLMESHLSSFISKCCSFLILILNRFHPRSLSSIKLMFSTKIINARITIIRMNFWDYITNKIIFDQCCLYWMCLRQYWCSIVKIYFAIL